MRSRGVYGDARYRICRAFGALRTFLHPASLLILNFSKAGSNREKREGRGALSRCVRNFLAMVLHGGVVRSCRWVQKKPSTLVGRGRCARKSSKPACRPLSILRHPMFFFPHHASCGFRRGPTRSLPPREIGYSPDNALHRRSFSCTWSDCEIKST